jgi:hypothetical protein
MRVKARSGMIAAAARLVVSRGIAGGQTQAAQCLQAQTHREQDVRRVERAGGAGRPARGGYAGQVERQQQVLAAAIRKRAGRSWEPRIRARGDSAQLHEQRAQPAGLLRSHAGALIPIANARRERHRNCCRRPDVLATRAPAPLLRTSVEKGIDPHPVSDEEKAAPPGAQLVAADRNEVSPFWDSDPTRSRARVDVHEGVHRMRSRDDLGDRLDRADFVVGKADRDEACRRGNAIRIGPAETIDLRDAYAVAFRLKASHGTQHALMLGGPRHDRRAFRQAVRDAEEREVDRLGARAGEGDLGAVRAQRTRGEIASAIQRGPGGPAFGLRARRISLREVAERRRDLWKDGRGTRVVQEDAAISRGCGPAGG